MLRLAGFFKAVSWVFLALTLIHGTLLVGRQAYIDYGWLGVVVIFAIGVPLFWLLPLVGWFFLPASQMWWLMFFLLVFLVFAKGADWCKNAATPKELR